MKFSLLMQLKKTKKSSKEVSLLLAKQKRDILKDLVDMLVEQQIKIEQENKKDILEAKKNGKNAAFIDRLTISEKVFQNMINQLRQIAAQKDYANEIIEKKKLKNGVILEKIRVPLGVIGIIYESRPNITIDVAAICIKSGNAVVLRGGSDAFKTNKILINCIHQSLRKNGVSRDIVGFVEDTDRKLITQILSQDKMIDVIIPRGGYDLVRKVVSESKIPVLYHANGGARIYVDKSADLDLAVKVCINAKISRPATCNSLDTIVLHKDIANTFMTKFTKSLDGRAEIRVDAVATEKDYETEFLDYVVSTKIVKNLDEGIAFIQKYTKNHTEGIVANDKKIIDRFVKNIDAAAIFVNSSPRFHDGGVFGLGAEMGIATGKLHARGPIGAKELTTYKWIAYGDGQIRI